MENITQRLQIKQIDEIVETESQCRIRVTLANRDKTYYGERTGNIDLIDLDAKLTLAVQATLDAITLALIKPISFELKGINANEIFEGLGEGVVVVVISTYDGKSDIVMPGSCRITGDIVEAVVKATLDATNRITEPYLS
ncbi:MAG: hypothetical protein AB1489_26840 [Acidobacteriota bacterium]